MKILFVVQTENDYGSDVIYDGLCQRLGNENVLDYPERPIYHSILNPNYKYPSFFDYPVIKSDEEKVKMLENNEFDCILVTCRIRSRYSGKFHELLKIKSKIIPTFIIDQDDLSGKNIIIESELNSKGYFKREYLGESDMIPLSLSYPNKYIPLNINTRRTNPLFWAGHFNSYRTEYLEACKHLIGHHKNYPQDVYRSKLLESKIGLNLRGFGFDCTRRYEIPAHGTMLFSEKLPIIIINDFTDGENAVFFSSLNEFNEKLNYLLNNDDYINKIRLSGHEHLLKYHTGTVRATQLLETVNSII